MGDTAAPKKKGAFFFKKPAWLENQVKNEVKPQSKEATEIFSRSTHADKEILAEEERKKQLEAEKRVKAAEEEAHEKTNKRRRVSNEDEDFEATNSYRKKSASPTQARSSPHSLSKRYDALVAAAGKSKRQPVVIDLGDSSDEEGESNRAVVSNVIPKPPAKSDDEVEEEEEFPELAAKARERVRQRLLATQQQQNTSANSTDPSSTGFLPAPADLGPNIQVFVQTRIPGTEPLLVMRKYRQNLKLIRVAWCKKQGFDQDFSDTVFFTYRGHRVFDVASCKSLGIDLDEAGNPVFKRGRNEGMENGDKLVLVATTQAIFDEEKKAAELARKKAEDEAEGIVEVPEQPKEKSIRIVLKAKGVEQRLIVRGGTTFEKIAGAFRSKQNIPVEKEISLQWDGEVLDPDATMESTDIEDMESIEVHIR